MRSAASWRVPTSIPQAPDHLSIRYDPKPLNTAWKLPTIERILSDSNTRTGPVDESSSQKKQFVASDADDVTSVSDWGLAAATNHFRDSHVHDQDYRKLIEKAGGWDEVHHQLWLRNLAGIPFIKSIQGRIEGSLQRNCTDGEEYFPIDAFESIFTPECILLLLLEEFHGAAITQVMRILDHIGKQTGPSRRRLFGILTFMNRRKYLVNFIGAGIYDSDLPLKPSTKSQRSFESQKTNTINTSLFKGWARTDVDLFYIYQKMFCIPFFDFQHNSLCFYVLTADVTLPWQVLEHKSTGGSGIVYKLQIHPGHHNFRSESQVKFCSPGYHTALIPCIKDSHEMTFFALKKIDWIDRQAYREELVALQRSRAQITQDKHLIRLLLALQHGERLYLLFEWADGNLLNLWEEVPCKDPSGSTIQRWAANQCFGVANAVRRIHGLTTGQIQRRSSSPKDVTDKIKEWGRHGDIKPSNILWFKTYKGDGNVLVISDLGLTRYHSFHTKSLVPRIDGYTSAYAAPEFELNQPISQKYDIWSLGCVFLEFCIWYVKGNNAVFEFESELVDQHESDISNFDHDNYFVIKTDGNGQKSAQLKPAVTTWIADLRDCPRSSDFVLKMLDLIQDRMLVVDVDKRWSISYVCREISDIRSSLPKFEHTEDLLLGIGVGAEQALK